MLLEKFIINIKQLFNSEKIITSFEDSRLIKTIEEK